MVSTVKGNKMELNDNNTITLPVLPLRGMVVFPRSIIHFDVGRKQSISAINRAMKSDQLIFLAAQKDPTQNEPQPFDLYPIGVVAKVAQVLKQPDDVTRVVLEGKYRARLSSHVFDAKIMMAQVFPLACPLLVPLVENGRFSKDDIVVTTILKEYIDQLTVHDVDTIVLGCTHYPLLMDAIKSIVPEINVISSSDAAAEALYDSLRRHGLLNEGKGGKHRYYVSDDAESFSRNASIFLDEDLDGEVDQVRI